MMINILVSFIAAEHLFFMILEMFFWKSVYARKAFKMSMEKAITTEALAMNQGLYNGFLAAGLIWSLFLVDSIQIRSTQIFFLSCVAVAGVVGAMTANKRIIFIQAMPALIALALIFFS